MECARYFVRVADVKRDCRPSPLSYSLCLPATPLRTSQHSKPTESLVHLQMFPVKAYREEWAIDIMLNSLVKELRFVKAKLKC